jgi:O-antigen ligase
LRSRERFNPSVTKTWISQLGRILVLLFLVLGLIVPQIAVVATGLLLSLPAYGLIGIAAVAAFLAFPSASPANRSCLWATGIFGGYVILRALTSPEPYAARADLYEMIGTLTLYGLTAVALNTARHRMVLIMILMVFAVFHVFFGVLQFGIGENFTFFPSLQPEEITRRANGLYINPDHLAGLLEVLGILGLSITCWSRWPRVTRVIMGYLTAICYFGLALTGSRGGYLSAAASLVVFAMLSGMALRAEGSPFMQKYGRIGSILAVVAVLTIGVFLIRQSESLEKRLNTVGAKDDTRLNLWGASIRQWQLNPLFGTGSGTYRFYGREFRNEESQGDPVNVHNDYLHLLCEYGLIGLIAFALFFAAHVRRGWLDFKRLGPLRLASGSAAPSDRLALNIGALGAVGAYVVHSMVDFNLHIPANALVVAFVFGMIANPGPKASAEMSPHRTKLTPALIVAALGIVLIVQSIRLIPGEFYAARARAVLGDEHPADALSLATRALANEQRNPNIFFCVGRAELALGDQARQSGKEPGIVASHYDAALTAFDRARQIAPLEEAYPLDMAYVFDLTGRFTEAEWMFHIARSLDPRSVAIGHLYQAHLERWRNSGQNSGQNSALVGTNVTSSRSVRRDRKNA